MPRFLRTLPLFLAFCWCSLGALGSEAYTDKDFRVIEPPVYIQGKSTEIELVATESLNRQLVNDTVGFQINGKLVFAQFINGRALVEVNFDRAEPLSIRRDGFIYLKDVHPVPLHLSILPPLLAIAMALVFREVVSSLLCGIAVGVGIVGWYSGSWLGLGGRLVSLTSDLVVPAMADTGHVSVILFSTLIGGLVALISKNGGAQGIVNRVSRFATDAKKGQLATWVLGVVIFFDDYANTLIVGSTMRPVTDRLRISREKLAFLVDSTAAPIAAIAFVTTWIGAELGYLQSGIEAIQASGHGEFVRTPYALFTMSLKYSFYPIMVLVFMLVLILFSRDFGAMYRAEMRQRAIDPAQQTQQAETDDELKTFAPAPGVAHRAVNAVVPVVTLLLVTMASLLVTGWNESVWANTELSFGRKLSETVGAADSYLALLWGSSVALVVAVALTVSQRLLSLHKTIDAIVGGFKSMVPALVVLILAWSLAEVTEVMGTADYLTQLLGSSLPFWSIPAITFVLAAGVAFSTGTSWGTMAILYPLVLPLAYQAGLLEGYDHENILPIFLNATSAVLAGAVLGDHCSPISDTTILSSLASGCDHIAHVRTQMPYALTVGCVALFVGTIPAALGVSPWICMVVGISILIAIARYLGKKVPYQLV